MIDLLLIASVVLNLILFRAWDKERRKNEEEV